ncbi:uncharacterized protein DNG_08143 [Cephalotrichum gorgonifer]|uniref:Rhodopsin domain-containing protein n=1 Tax=Cephalotrichum gorgonifer TaxID=2041049 RepID=A0AAE8N2X9_9PEZI|nr:uncharacterized protein DNG_08143 [Cephalotrichum gorgonifer]
MTLYGERPPGFDPANDYESRASTVIGVAIAFGLLTLIFTSLRLYTRIKILGIFAADDWAMCGAQFISVAVSVLSILEAKWALGRHVWVVHPNDVMLQIQVLLGVILGYNFGINVVKMGLLLLYLRIFQSTSLKIVAKWFLGFVIVWSIVQIVLLTITCVPIFIIVPSMADKCLDTYPVWLTSSIMSTVTDVLIFLLPLPSVLKLNLKLKQKIVTVLMFSVGFFTCIVSVIRIFSLKGAVTATDPTWDNVGPGCWSIVELNSAILCCNLPTLRPLVVRYFPSLGMGSSNATGAYRKYGNSRDPEAYIKSTGGGRSGGGSRFTTASRVELDADGTESTENLKMGATAYSTGGGGMAVDEIELVGAHKGRGAILVTTEMVVSAEEAERARNGPYQPYQPFRN